MAFIVPETDYSNPDNFDFGPVPENGEYEVEVLDNAEGQVKSGRNEGVPKMTVTFAVPAATIKSTLHCSVGGFSLKNLIQTLLPEFGAAGGEIPDGCLRGMKCRALIVNEEFPKDSGIYSGKIRKLLPLHAPESEPVKPKPAAAKPKPAVGKPTAAKPSAAAPAAGAPPPAAPPAEENPWA